MKILIETEDDSDGSLVQHTYAVESSILWNCVCGGGGGGVIGESIWPRKSILFQHPNSLQGTEDFEIKTTILEGSFNITLLFFFAKNAIDRFWTK